MTAKAEEPKPLVVLLWEAPLTAIEVNTVFTKIQVKAQTFPIKRTKILSVLVLTVKQNSVKINFNKDLAHKNTIEATLGQSTAKEKATATKICTAKEKSDQTLVKDKAEMLTVLSMVTVAMAMVTDKATLTGIATVTEIATMTSAATTYVTDKITKIPIQILTSRAELNLFLQVPMATL